ncbi:MAG: hypothetical protein KAY22_21885 [Rhizorhabdus sp.]|uniref:hypothetical protein n=1 Tax=Rhizorhabdus sp. TaxID=1968843 RepID=UPI001B420596|nr:hypothetical protein [Rhizorhabdus sp.]MBP8234949.1 hypothetical protein [Rhizorhabdus sp.]
MTGEENTPRRARHGDRALALSIAAVVACLLASALLDGTSFDDLWTLYLADAGKPIETLAHLRWSLDIRPPVFDAWASLLSRMGLDLVAVARLISHVPALLFLLLAGRSFMHRLPEERQFHAIFLLLMLSAPATIHAIGLYRGDFWQLSAFAIQIMLARHILYVQEDYRSRKDGRIALFGLLATIAAITLDYGGALFGSVLAMATILAAMARGLGRWARSLILTLAISVAAVVAAISWQAPSWSRHFDLYQNWIDLEATSAFAVMTGLLIGTLAHNPIAIAGAYLGRQKWTRHDSGFAALLGISLVAALVAILQIDAQRRLVTTSNSADLAVLAAALMATAGMKLLDSRLWTNALCAVAVVSAIVSMAVGGLGGGWQNGAKKIARIVDQCPQSQVYAASGWRIDDGSSSRAARREEPVFALGYQRLAKLNGFPVTLLREGKPVRTRLSQCPVLLWIEQVPPFVRPKPDKIIRMSGLQGLEAARLSLIRTHSGLILRAER